MVLQFCHFDSLLLLVYITFFITQVLLQKSTTYLVISPTVETILVVT